METEGRTVVARGWAREQGFVTSGHERAFWSDGKIWKWGGADGWVTLKSQLLACDMNSVSYCTVLNLSLHLWVGHTSALVLQEPKITPVYCQARFLAWNRHLVNGITLTRAFHVCVLAKSLQLCLTLWDPVGCSLPGSSVHGILQARILEWFAMPSLQGIFLIQGLNQHFLGLLHWQVSSLPLAPSGKLRLIQYKGKSFWSMYLSVMEIMGAHR